MEFYSSFFLNLYFLYFNPLQFFTGSVVLPRDLTGPWFSFRGLDRQKPFYCEVCDKFLRPERNLTHDDPPCII